MSHHPKGRASAVLDTFSGTVTLAQPTDLPEGASPRNQNCDFSVGSVFTRQGLANVFSYSGASSGPNSGLSANDSGGGVASWNTPLNVFSASLYTSCNIPNFVTLSIKTLQYVSILSNKHLIVTFTTTPPTFISGQTYTLSGITNHPELNGLVLSNGIISGNSVTFPYTATFYGWGPEDDTGQAVVTPILNPLSDFLNATEFGFSLSPQSSTSGVVVSFDAYGDPFQTLSVQLISGGIALGQAKTVFLNGTPTSYSLGGDLDSWNALLNSLLINATSFGVRLQVTGAQSAYIKNLTIKVYHTSSSANFDYVTTFEDDFGNIRTIALDAAGSWWIENVNSTPNVLVPLSSIVGTPENSYATSFTADSRIFFAISDLVRGNYPPQSYNNQWSDRLSQVGPGASASFSSTLTSGGTATVTAYSYSTGILTLTAANSYTAGEIVTISAGPSDALYPLNGLSFEVLGTGLSATQFEIAETSVTGSGTSSANVSGQYTYPIAASPNGITQYPFWNSAQGYQSQLDDVLWSAGPGSTDSGNVITVYYLQGSHGLPDANLVKAFQDGKFPVYVYVSGTNQPLANGTHLVTSIGAGFPPGAAATRWYFTFSVASTGYSNLGGGSNSQPGQYQLTVATLNTSQSLPGIQTGDSVTLAGNTVSAWNTSFKIVNSLNSGAFSISETEMTSGVATYHWALSGDTANPPTSGQSVTITGCLNGNGIFNVTNAAILSVTGTSSGTFTVAGFAQNLTYSAQSEDAQATTGGTKFQIDPGVLAVGTTSNPIYGNSGGGYITLVGTSSAVIAAGTRKGTVFFITRNGYWTAPAPPVQFTTTENSNYILVSNIPIGPPNVVARGIALTEAGSGGVSGASYYTIPDPVTFVYNNVTYTSSSFIIQDNTTTTAKLTFSDSVLLNAQEIDIQGSNLFNLQELGDSAWCCQYAGRGVYGRVNNKVPNFLNMSFDGGYLSNPGGNILPLGWGLDAQTSPNGSAPTLLNSPVFGNSYYIHNTTGTTQTALGRITQSAYQDYYGVSILKTNVLYSVRVTCRTPSSSPSGALIVDLTSYNTATGYGKTYGTFTLNCIGMTSSMVTYTGVLLADGFLSVPTDLFLRVWAENLPNDGDIEVDRLEVYPTLAPQNTTGLTISYKNDWESFDATTGGTDTSTVNAQPANGGFVMDSKLYVLKESSLGYLSDTPGQEPADWNPFRQISNVAGASGIYAWDAKTERWAIFGNQSGLYMFAAGAPEAIQLDIPDIWNAINWKTGGQSVVIRNDVENRRIFIAAPMTTPNQWCPDFPEATNPTSPNVIIYLNYAGIQTFEEISSASTLHTTMTGKLASRDMRRKWSLWSIATPYIGYCKRSELSSEMLFCNGISSSKIYKLDSYKSGTDDGVEFPQSYCTYGFVSKEQAESNPLLGDYCKRFALWQAIIRGSGTASFTFYQNVLGAPYPFVVPGGVKLSDPSINDMFGPLNIYASRVFAEIKMQGSGRWFNLSRLTLAGTEDAWSPIRGVNGYGR